jgi:hypothetical protein
MAHTFLIFDFGSDEKAAQQARHKVESWKQGFRLGNKILLKFEREDNEAKPESGADDSEAQGKGKKTASAKKEKSGKAEAGSHIRVLVRLDFSDHEKLSHQRWLDRIPAEEAFKSAKSEIVRPGDAEFDKTSTHFESLD